MFLERSFCHGQYFLLSQDCQILKMDLIIKLIDIIENKELESEIKGLINLNLKNLKKHFKKYNKQKNNVLKAHYDYCFELLKDY